MHKIPWSKKRPRYKFGPNQHHSISAKLKEDGRSNDEFEIMLGRLTIEELIALKLEVTARSLNDKLYGFNLWTTVPTMARAALVHYAYTGTRTKGEMRSFLGIDGKILKKILEDYKLDEYFSKKPLDDD